jgi:hypothetical protein
LKLLKEHSLFVLILLSCIVLRVLPILDYQFTLDEWSGLDRTQFNSFGELIEGGVKIDAHPALVQVLLYFLVKLFGYTTWIIKLPFLLFSFGTVIYAYAICIRNFSKQSGLIASALLSYSLIFVYYAPIARMYISGLFFSMALLYYFFELFFKKEYKLKNYFFLGLFALLSALNQHVNALFALIVCASGLFFAEKGKLKAYLITCAGIVLLYLPHLSVTLYQLGIGGIGFAQGGWIAVPEPLAVVRFLKVLLGTGKSYLILMGLFFLCMALNRKYVLNKAQWYLLSVFVVNYLVIYFYSVYKASVFQYSVMLFSSAAFVIFFASFFELKNKYIFGFVFLVLSSTLFYKTYIKKSYLTECVRNTSELQYDRTEACSHIGGFPLQAVFFDTYNFIDKVCSKKYPTICPYKITNDSAKLSLGEFTKLVSESNTENFALGSADPLQQALVKDKYRFLVRSVQSREVNYKMFSRLNPISVKDDEVLYSSTSSSPAEFVYDKPNGISLENDGIRLNVDSLTEFPLAARSELNKISSKEGQVLLAKGKIKVSGKIPEGVQLCISLTDSKTDSSYYFSSNKSSDFVMDKDSCLTLYAEAFLGTDYYKIREKTKVSVFFWNTAKEKFTIRELEIKTIDYLPTRWGFWD